ncbi:MAG: rhamnogalacturonan acetylesterase [Prolixibacteraceae bacterium]|jgi:DNA sulfur modification protein DndE|nr:rhamnogalacturonan acetylesterase [Prolixibacteraceae bacterium]
MNSQAKNNIKAWLLILISVTAFSCQKSQPVMFLIGDSTMANKPDLDYPERGWGQLLPTFFDTSFVIDNHSRNGRSTRSFLYEARWDSVQSKLKKGDFVVIQFGHNDGSISKTERYATPVEYRYNLTKFVKDTQNKGAKPILCTPVIRRKFKDGVLVETHGEYPKIVEEIASEMNIPFIDMHKKSWDLVSDLGEKESLPLFLQIPAGIYEKYPEGKIDNTHFSEQGAIAIAGLFVDEVKKQELEFAMYLKNKNP